MGLRVFLVVCLYSLLWENFACFFKTLFYLLSGTRRDYEGETGMAAMSYLPRFPMSLNAFYFEIPGGTWQR